MCCSAARQKGKRGKKGPEKGEKGGKRPSPAPKPHALCCSAALQLPQSVHEPRTHTCRPENHLLLVAESAKKIRRCPYYETFKWEWSSCFLIWAATTKYTGSSRSHCKNHLHTPSALKSSVSLVAESSPKYEDVPTMRPSNGNGHPIS
jgi:hypothetical protein